MSTAIVIACGALVAGVALLLVGLATHGRRRGADHDAEPATSSRGNDAPGAEDRAASLSVTGEVTAVAVSSALAARPAIEPVGRLRILVIDDEPMVGQMIARLLQSYDTTAVTSGQAALATLAADDKFDAILCDMMMPGLTGTRLADAIAERHRALRQRIIFMSATADAARLLYRSELRWIAKPVRYAQLALSINEVVAAAGSSGADLPAELVAAGS